MTKINYRRDYICSSCGSVSVKLWRDYNTCASACDLKCCECLTPAQVKCEAGYSKAAASFLGALDADGLFMFRDGDQLGGMVPAIPTPDGDTFWGYSSVPNEDILWWYELPTYPNAGLELRCLRALIGREQDRYTYNQQEVVRLRGEIDALRLVMRYRREWPETIPQLAETETAGDDPGVHRKLLLSLLKINGDLMAMSSKLYAALDDLRWKLDRRVYAFTCAAKVLIYTHEVHESESFRAYVPVEQYRDVGPNDRVATGSSRSRERAYLLDQKEDSFRKAYSIMEYDQDAQRWIREQLAAGVLREVPSW